MVSLLATSGEGQCEATACGFQEQPRHPHHLQRTVGASGWSWGSGRPCWAPEAAATHRPCSGTPDSQLLGMHPGAGCSGPWPVSEVLGRQDCQSHYSTPPTGPHGVASLPGRQVHPEFEEMLVPRKISISPWRTGWPFATSCPDWMLGPQGLCLTPTLRVCPARVGKGLGGRGKEVWDALQRCAQDLPASPQALPVGQQDLIPAVESQPGSEADQVQERPEAHLAEGRPEGNPP